MAKAVKTELTEDEWAELENREDCEESRNSIQDILNKLFPILENGGKNENLYLLQQLGERFWTLTHRLEKSGPLTIRDKSIISSDISVLVHDIYSLLFEFEDLSTQQKRIEAHARAAIARSSLPDLSPRNDEIVRLAVAAGLKKPRLLSSANAMAQEILADVNSWIELNNVGNVVERDAVRKVLAANSVRWKDI
jgi:hypothetical protein